MPPDTVRRDDEPAPGGGPGAGSPVVGLDRGRMERIAASLNSACQAVSVLSRRVDAVATVFRAFAGYNRAPLLSQDEMRWTPPADEGVIRSCP